MEVTGSLLVNMTRIVLLNVNQHIDLITYFDYGLYKTYIDIVLLQRAIRLISELSKELHAI